MSAYFVCCTYSKFTPDYFTKEANTMNPDQTAPKGALLSGSIVFAIKQGYRLTFFRQKQAKPLKQNDWGPSPKQRGPGFGVKFN